MFFWQTTLLRHFVPFTHQLAVPWDKAGRQETCSKREEPRPSTWQGDSRTQQQAAADYLARGLGWAGGGLFPTNFNPFTQPYATYDAALWKEKWDTQQQEQAPLAAHSLRFRHAHTLHQTHTHTHTLSKTIECSPTLTHETDQLATKKHLHYHTLVDSQALEPTLWLEFTSLTNASFHREKLLSCTPPISPVSLQTSFEPAAAPRSRRAPCKERWSSRWQVVRVGGWVRGWNRVCEHRWRNETSKRGCGWAHHSQTRSRIPEGWSTAPAPLLPLLPATQAVLLPPWTMTSSSKRKKKKKNKEKEGKEGKCVRENTPASEAGEEKCGEAHEISFYLPPRFPFWSNLHRFQWWCCLLTSVAVNDTEPGSYGSDGRSEKRRRKTRGEEKGKEEGRTQQSMCHWGKRRRGDTKVKPLRWQQREKLTGNQKPSPERNEERTKKKKKKKRAIRAAQGAFAVSTERWALQSPPWLH